MSCGFFDPLPKVNQTGLCCLQTRAKDTQNSRFVVKIVAINEFKVVGRDTANLALAILSLPPIV